MGEALYSDPSVWTIGPYHRALSGPMRLKLRLDGEIIVRADVETGFAHKGLEKSFELQPWVSAPITAGRLDPECAAVGEFAFCLAVEQVSDIEVPMRAQAIRVIVAELARVSMHFAFIARLARAVGTETAFHYVQRDREKILDLFELLTGARFSLGFFRYGGVAADVTEGFMERVLEVCDLIQVRLKEYNDLFSYSQAFLLRTQGIGVVRIEKASLHGVTGPTLRASGVAFDVRKGHPYSSYEKYDFTVPCDHDPSIRGDAHQRYLFRLREIVQSLEILKQAIETLPDGPFEIARIPKDFTIPAGEAYVRTESPRGLLGCFLVADGMDRPARVQFRVPSVSALSYLPELLLGSRLDDLPVILASLDLSIAEVDR